MILILTKHDLTQESQDLSIKDIKISDIKSSLNPIKKSSLVILRIGENIKILKDKYSIYGSGVFSHLSIGSIITTHLQYLT